MTKLTNMAISMALELGINHETPTNLPRRIVSGRYVVEHAPGQEQRTSEERRTLLALFHLTSSYV